MDLPVPGFMKFARISCLRQESTWKLAQCQSNFVGSAHHLLNMAGFQTFLRINSVDFNLERDALWRLSAWMPCSLVWLVLRCKQRQGEISEAIFTCKPCNTQCSQGRVGKCKFQVRVNEKQTNMRMGKGDLKFRSGLLCPRISPVLLPLAHCSR